MARTVVAALVAAALALALGGAGPARAATATTAAPPARSGSTPGSQPKDPNALVAPSTLLVPPDGRRLSGRTVLRIAAAVPKIRTVLRHHPRATRQAFLKGADRWQVSFYDPPDKEIGQVIVADATGQVLEAWTGPQVAWTMARGYAGAFGRKAAAVWVWLPLLALFVLPFVDPRRPFRARHLDLLVLAGLSVSLAFFSHGDIDASVPLAYPVLLYLLGRMLWLGLRRRRGEEEPLRLLVPPRWLAVGVLFLVGFRVGLNVTNSNVIDVGYSGVIGAHKIIHGQALWGHFPVDDPHGDTYGPFTYLAYVPWVALLGWSGHWDDLPAAHGAAITFDLATLAVLWLLGRRLGGPTLAWALAWAWVAYPFTLFVANSNANDSLVALLVSGALLAIASAPRRGASMALAGLAKFAPLALAPLLLGAGRGSSPRVAARYLAGAVAAGVVVLGVVAATSGLGGLWSRTLGYQADRGSPFSIWGLWGWTGAPQIAAQLLAVVLAVGLALGPRRRREAPAVAALAAAVLIALQLGITHWFYLYVVWFFPLVMVALLARGPARSTPPAAAGAPPG
jgi:glycosyl transferase family 87